MNIFFVILFVLMLSLVQTDAYDSYEAENNGAPDLVLYQSGLRMNSNSIPETIERYPDEWDYSWTDPGFRSCTQRGMVKIPLVTTAGEYVNRM